MAIFVLAQTHVHMHMISDVLKTKWKYNKYI
jgi:hypothetical protein